LSVRSPKRIRKRRRSPKPGRSREPRNKDIMATKKPEKPKKKKPLPPRPRPYGKTWSFTKGVLPKGTGPEGKTKHLVAGGPRKYSQKKKYIEDEGGTEVTTERELRKGRTGGKKKKKPSVQMGMKGKKQDIKASKGKKIPPAKKKHKKVKPVYVKIAEKTTTGTPSDMPLVKPKKGARSKDEGMIHDPQKMTEKRRRMLESQKWA